MWDARTHTTAMGFLHFVFHWCFLVFEKVNALLVPVHMHLVCVEEIRVHTQNQVYINGYRSFSTPLINSSNLT